MTEPEPEFIQPSAAPRRRHDWLSPLLLTLSLHLMFFTLLVNQRLFTLVGQSRGAGEYVLSVGAQPGIDEHTSDEQAGAAPGEPAPAVGPQPQSVKDALKSDAAPQPAAREEATPKEAPVEKDLPGKPAQPADSRSLAERLAGSVGSEGGHKGSETPVNPGGGSHGLRGQGKRGSGLKENGGSAQTENAVEMGLAWLARVQDSDGRWDSDGFMVHYMRNPTFEERMAEGPGGTYKDVGLTALCLLAFTGAGLSEDDVRYGQVVAGARKFLLNEQRTEDGGFGRVHVQSPDMYDHALATMAIADLYLNNGDENLRTPLRRALLYLLLQQRKGGGWNYGQTLPGAGGSRLLVEERNDLSISGWCILALIAGREAGFEIPKENLARLVDFLRKATTSDGEGTYADIGTRAGDRGRAMTAVSQVCRRLLGEPGASPTQKKQRSILAANPPDWSKVRDKANGSFYLWYYGSLGLLLSKEDEGGSDRWREWNIGLKGALVNNQCKDGGRRGSFDPAEYWAEHGGGRLYATAINVLSLEIYYRYEPEYLRSRASEFADLWGK